MEGCKYCKEVFADPEKDCTAKRLLTYNFRTMFNSHSELYLKIDCAANLKIVGFDDGDAKTAGRIRIKYCPMCGAAFPDKTVTEIAYPDIAKVL